MGIDIDEMKPGDAMISAQEMLESRILIGKGKFHLCLRGRDGDPKAMAFTSYAAVLKFSGDLMTAALVVFPDEAKEMASTATKLLAALKDEASRG